MLTHRQKECLDFIEGYIASTGGVSPTYDEIKTSLGIKSRSGVHQLLWALGERGFIRWLPHRSRAIEIIPRVKREEAPKVIPLVDLSRGQTYFVWDREAEALVPWTPP